MVCAQTLVNVSHSTAGRRVQVHGAEARALKPRKIGKLSKKKKKKKKKGGGIKANFSPMSNDS